MAFTYIKCVLPRLRVVKLGERRNVMPLTANEIIAAKFNYECILLAGTDEDRIPHWEVISGMMRKDTVKQLRELGLRAVIEVINQRREKQGLPRKTYAIVLGSRKEG
jgi:hypothetical protein